MKTPIINLQLAQQLGLTEEEYNKILSLLQRTPTYTELGIYSVMWSEHCSYKNSIALLKTLPRSGGKLLVSGGEENAGLVDIGDGLAVAFKIESHNHPSAVEPYQGAATGVGGIMRDIFTMGARPVAALNSLRFGSLTDARTKHLFKYVVKGIGDYGNSFGVPTVAGEIYFDECYQGNPLVNAMAVGIVEHKNTASAIARGKNNLVMIVGSSTGRDGIHGATFASEEISEKSEAKRPSVQVGDPFTEKLLLEATLEVIKAGYIVGIQDMGAAGITCSTMEMSAKGKSGMLIDLDKVPLREENMTAYEIMLSESQERMLLVAKPEHEQKIKSIFDKWDLHCVTIGKVTDDGIVKIMYQGRVEAEVPAETLVLGGGAPVYIRETKEPEYLQHTRPFDFSQLPQPKNFNTVLEKLLASPNIANKHWAYEQYDSMVQTNTITQAGKSDSAIIKIKGTKKYLTVKTDCNSRYVYLNPHKGAEIAVAESARNVVCSGGKPLAITNCLNFGNPYKPEIYWQFKEAIAGIANACNILETPVTGGNVSFYNESPNAAVYPTPTIGMLGLIEDAKHITTPAFKNAGDEIILLGKNTGDLSGSEYAKVIHNIVAGSPTIDIEFEKKLQTCCLEMIYNGLIQSMHDISEGGISVGLAECCIFGNLGCTVNFAETSLRKDFLLFGEEQSRILISVKPENLNTIKNLCEENLIPYEHIGKVTTTKELIIGKEIQKGIEQLQDIYMNTITNIMKQAL